MASRPRSCDVLRDHGASFVEPRRTGCAMTAGSRSSIDRAIEGDESSKGAFSLSSRSVPAIDRSPAGRINDQARRTKLPGRREKLLSKSYRGALVGERPKRRRPRLGPAIRHDAEGFDEALPAAREGERHPEIEHLVVREVP